MTNRQKEEKLVGSLRDPTENHSTEITRLIDKTIKNRHNVYCMTDWHLWLRNEKNKPACHKRNNFDEIIKNIKKIQPDDVFIFLGDLVDGEFEDKDSLKNILLPMNFKKILVIGNNDLFSPAFYKSCGFDYVVRSFTWHDVLFTHMPVKNDNDINVHGHIHGYKTYWIPYTNQIDVAYLDGRTEPVELQRVLKSQKSYSKVIKEEPSHFEEGYSNYSVTKSSALFCEVMNVNKIEDPYN